MEKIKSLLARIEIDPEICGGRPVFKNTRITVSSILGYLMAGDTVEILLDNFPDLVREDIAAAYAFAINTAETEHDVLTLSDAA